MTETKATYTVKKPVLTEIFNLITIEDGDMQDDILTRAEFARTFPHLERMFADQIERGENLLIQFHVGGTKVSIRVEYYGG